MATKDVPLTVVCGSGVEDGRPTFWAVDTSDSRIFVVPESTRVDSVYDQLMDWVGKDSVVDADTICLKPTVLSRRCDQIVSFITRKLEKEIERMTTEDEQ